MAYDIAGHDYKSLADFRLTLRAFFRFSEKAAAKAGLTSQQYQVLLAIKAAPGSALTVGALAEEMYLTPQSVTGLVNRLDKLGMVERARRPEDRREISVTLSKTGFHLLVSLAAAHRSELRRLKPMLAEIIAQL